MAPTARPRGRTPSLPGRHRHDFDPGQPGSAVRPRPRGEHDADRYRGLTSTAIPSYVKALWEGIQEGLDFEGVIEASFVETLRDDPQRMDPWYEFTDRKATWLYHGRVPINMHLVDDVALIWLGEHDGDDLEVYGLLESENPAVVEWAESFYEEYRIDSELLDAATLSEA